MKARFPDAETGAQNLLHNRLWQGAKEGKGETKHTPPATGHYPDVFYWDSVFASLVNSAASYDGPNQQRWLRAAQWDLIEVARGVQPDGFLPNLRFTEGSHPINVEKIIALGRKATSTNYTQPPVLALGVNEAYKASRRQNVADADHFLNDIYPLVHGHMRYFDEQLSNSPTDKLSGIYHPHTTGRDSDPTFDGYKPHRIGRNGNKTPILVDKLNIGLDYLDVMTIGIKLRHAHGDMEKMREVFWVNDVMMNCIYVDNLLEASELARATYNISDIRYFNDQARQVEQQIYDKLWFPDARDGRGAFYALDGKGEPIHETSVSNLFPLTLPNLSEAQLESLLDLLDEGFNVPFPLPSVATFSPNFDPHNRESERLWRGPTWMNTNWYIAQRGLRRQIARPELQHRGDLIDRCAAWADRIAMSSRGLIDLSDLREHYDPLSGKGQRARVQNFAWSNLAFLMHASGDEH
jgi:hypothetical protein